MIDLLQYVLTYIFREISIGGIFESLGVAALAGVSLYAAGVIIRRAI